MEYFCMTPNIQFNKDDVNPFNPTSSSCHVSDSSMTVESVDQFATESKDASSCSQPPVVSQSTNVKDFVPPTNQASSTQQQGVLMMYRCKSNPGELPTGNKSSNSLHLLRRERLHSPCLPVSKGSIKKMAQTRFVNSSPQSYRLMPASIESSDMTSFVEKSPHKSVSSFFFNPFFLEAFCTLELNIVLSSTRPFYYLSIHSSI